MTEILPGAEGWSSDGGANGALVIHGFTGNPSSMRSLAEALAAAGYAVEMPRLPGHGTSIDDMLTTSFADWSGEVEAAYQRLAARCEKVVVTGLSMGGTLGAWVTARHPEIAGFAPINGAFESSPEMAIGIHAMVEAGETLMDGVGNDIADPGQIESAYAQVPLAGLKSLLDASDELQAALQKISCPVLILNSPQDHVVAPASSDHLAASVTGPVERVTLERSYHVATQDYDKDLIESSVVAFANRVTA